MPRYIEVLFLGRCRGAIAASIFLVSGTEFEIIQRNLMALEDADASDEVEDLFRSILRREAQPFTDGDRVAAAKAGVLVSLEYRESK